MDLKRCSAGHFYDADSFASCPHCMEGEANETSPLSTFAGSDDYGREYENEPTEKLTIYEDEPAETVSLTNLVEDAKNGSEDTQEKTVSFFESAIGSEPVVGWLVCVEGNHFGESFKLKAGKNFVGRSSKMDVCLSGDASVSREKHVVVMYDHNNNVFLVQAGDSKELSYHNGKLILSPAELGDRDEIQLGSTKLVFVPFCNKYFKWEVNKEENAE